MTAAGVTRDPAPCGRSARLRRRSGSTARPTVVSNERFPAASGLATTPSHGRSTGARGGVIHALIAVSNNASYTELLR